MDSISCHKESIGNKLDVRALGNEIVSHLTTSHQNLALTNFLINQALLHKATDIHLDLVDGKICLTLRIEGELLTIVKLDIKTGLKLTETLKEAAGQKGIFHQKPWTGQISLGHANIPKATIHIIPFPTTASVIIRLSPDAPPPPKKNTHPNSEQKIFIWQMGKVGSTTLLSSLKPYTLTKDKKVTAFPAECVQHNNLIHTHSAKPIFDLLHGTTEHFVIISMVRDLLARNISAVFQSMTEERAGNVNFIASREAFCKLKYKQQEERILQKVYAVNTDNHLLTWYDNLFKSHFYYPETDRYFIDIYKTPFDQTKGMQAYSSKVPRIKMAIIRLEDLNSLAEDIGNFLGINNFKLTHGNMSQNKWYNNIYQNFLERYHPTQDELDNIYNSKFMRYFYSPTEIDRFVCKWI